MYCFQIRKLVTIEYDDVQFIGLDRQEIDIENIDVCLCIAQIIKDTKQPNYKCARFPIKSGLMSRPGNTTLVTIRINKYCNI